MTSKNSKVIELEQVVIRFAGDSGDGMQLTGSLFSDSTAFAGNDFATFPDYPSEIRAPQGTVSGVSGFQIHFGQKTVHTSGDLADVLIAMNPASLKANMRWVKEGAIIILDGDTFIEKGLDSKLDNVVNSGFGRVTYTEAIEILKACGKEFDYKVEWGIDLQTEHERYVAEEHFKKPVFVTDYPKEIKSF